MRKAIVRNTSIFSNAGYLATDKLVENVKRKIKKKEGGFKGQSLNSNL